MITRIYEASLYGGPDKLEILGPLFVGGGVFAAIDIGFNLADPWRLILLAILAGPGSLWALYLTYHELRSLPGRCRRHGNVADDENR